MATPTPPGAILSRNLAAELNDLRAGRSKNNAQSELLTYLLAKGISSDSRLNELCSYITDSGYDEKLIGAIESDLVQIETERKAQIKQPPADTNAAHNPNQKPRPKGNKP